jgi:PII-like signaling protein
MTPEMVLRIVRVIYKSLRVWLAEEAKKSDTPVDDYMVEILDFLLRD